MKKLFTLSLIFFAGLATGQLTYLPQASPRAQVMQRIGASDILIEYSRPSVKERKVWGNLVPYGMAPNNFGTAKEMPWRAGANENTTISFPCDVKVQGAELRSGVYGLHMIPEESGEVTVIFSNNSTSWGSFFYDESEDALRVKTSMQEAPFHELLTYDFISAGPNSTVAALYWENKMIPFRIEVPVNDVVMDRIRKDLRNSSGFSRNTWEQAAAFALQAGKTDEALEWVNNAMAGKFYSEKTFQNASLKAIILKARGDNEAYEKMINEAMQMGSNAQMNQLGYQLLARQEYQLALKVFHENAIKNPEDPNVYDSLGDGYLKAGDRENAIKYLKKSLSLDPPAAVRANSVKLLQELGEEVN